MLHFLNDLKSENYLMIASLKSETMGKLINRIPGSCLLISSLPGSALRTLVESLASLVMSTSVLKDLPGKLSKDTHLVFSIYLPFIDISDNLVPAFLKLFSCFQNYTIILSPLSAFVLE